MSVFSVYDSKTGIIEYSVMLTAGDRLQSLVRDGQSCILGDYDGLSQRVDVATGLVIDYQPNQPSANHVWNAGSKRWLYVKTDGDIAGEVRAERDKLITACDWVVVRALDQGGAVPAEWSTYRSALRDISGQPGFPRSITWPSAPI